MCGPDSSVYGGGAFLLFVRFPPGYPADPPLLRFVTPIRHCNINSQAPPAARRRRRRRPAKGSREVASEGE